MNLLLTINTKAIQKRHTGFLIRKRQKLLWPLVETERKAGKPQTITFPKIEGQQAGTNSIKLNATSDSGLPVGYYVIAGPVVIEGNTLKFTKIPVKSKYPVKVTVVAYQWGRTIAPLY